jgi:hypothetical protein
VTVSAEGEPADVQEAALRALGLWKGDSS